MRNLTVVIPSKNPDNLYYCLKALRKHEKEVRIVIVDDGLDRAIIKKFPDNGKNIAIIQGIKPFIYARNCNLAMKCVPSDDIVLLNDDALLETPKGFTRLQHESMNNTSYGIIGATTNVTGQILQRRQNIGLREVPHIAFVCVFIPRRTLRQIGYLDERYCVDYGVEDRDYCTAVRRAGLKIGVHDSCFVDHGSLISTFRGDPKAPKSFQQNLKLYREKWGEYAEA